MYLLLRCPLFMLIPFGWMIMKRSVRLCFGKGTFFVADNICPAWERGQSIVFKTEL